MNEDTIAQSLASSGPGIQSDWKMISAGGVMSWEAQCKILALESAMKLPATKASDVTEKAEVIYQWLIGNTKSPVSGA